MFAAGVLSVGDDEGNIHLYDLTDVVQASSASSPSPLAPSRVRVQFRQFMVGGSGIPAVPLCGWCSVVHV